MKLRAALFTGLVDLGVGASDQRFEILTQVQVGGEGGEPREVGRTTLIEVVEAFGFCEGHTGAGIVVETPEGAVKFLPVGALGRSEAGYVEDHWVGLRRLMHKGREFFGTKPILDKVLCFVLVMQGIDKGADFEVVQDCARGAGKMHSAQGRGAGNPDNSRSQGPPDTDSVKGCEKKKNNRDERR